MKRRRFVQLFPLAGVMLLAACRLLVARPEKITDNKKEKPMPSIPRGYFSHHPPQCWEEAMLCGNGTIGAIVMANPFQETITLTHEKLFIPWKEKLPPVDTASHLSEIREMLEQGRFQEAAELPVTLAQAAGYGEKRWTDPFFPACDLKIKLAQAGPVSGYKQDLDYSTGIAAVEWQDDRGLLSRQVFVSRADGIAILSMTSTQTDGITCDITLGHRQPETEQDYWNGMDKFLQGLAAPVLFVEEGWLYFCGQFRREASGYECLARVIPNGGTQKVLPSSLRIEKAAGVLLFLAIRPLPSGSESAVEEMKQSLAALPADFESLLTRHTAIHTELFERTRLELSDRQDTSQPADEAWEDARQIGPSSAYFQRIFDAGRYEILSSCGDWPPNLQGVWSGIYGTPWSGDYTQNGNVQTAIAGLLDGNLPECMESYLRYIEFLSEESRVNAQALYNCRGVLLASRTSSHGLNNHFDATWPMTFWTAGSGWASHFFYDLWLHTCDDNFFRQRALPYMKETALFYEEFLAEDENGYWQFTPSYSPENHPGNSISQACINATMDIAIARELFSNLIEGCRTLGLEVENLPRWERILAKMPPYLINADGAAKEWCDPRLEDNYDHRHASHLYPLMYGVSRELRDNRDLLQAFTKAYQFRLAGRKKEADMMAFGSVQLAQAAVHLRDTATVEAILKDLASGYYYKNFATSHDRGPSIFNADLSGGMPALMLACLMQSEPVQDSQGHIEAFRLHPLPALPSFWPQGRLSGGLARGGFIVDVEWEDNALQKLTIRNPRKKKCLVNYQGKEITLEDFEEKMLTRDLFY